MWVKKCLVVISGCFTMFLALGFPYNMSVLYVEFLKEFEKSNAETAVVQSTCISVLLIMGIPAGMLISHFGTMRVGITSGALISFGLTLSYFATSLIYLDIFIGVITGLGAAAAVIASPTSVGESFTGIQKHVALSCVSSFGSVSGIAFPSILNAFIEKYEWRGCLLLIGGLTLNIIPLSAIYGRFRTKPKSKLDHEDEETPLLANDNSVEDSICNIKDIESVETSDILSSIEKHFTDELRNRNESSSKMQHSLFLNIRSLMKNKVYLLHVIAHVLGATALNAIQVSMVDFLEWKEFSKSEAIELYTYMSVGCLVSAIVIAIANAVTIINMHILPILYATFCAVTLCLLPFLTSYIQHVFILIIYGLGNGGIIVWRYVGTMKIVGSEVYAEGLGVVMTMLGITTVIAGPIAGWMFDITQAYYGTFISAGSSTLICSLLYANVYRMSRGDTFRNQQS